MSFTETFLNVDVFVRVLPLLLAGLWMTIKLAVAAVLFGLPGGLLVAIARLYAPAPLRILSTGFIDIFRAIPMLILLILLYYALPFMACGSVRSRRR